MVHSSNHFRPCSNKIVHLVAQNKKVLLIFLGLRFVCFVNKNFFRLENWNRLRKKSFIQLNKIWILIKFSCFLNFPECGFYYKLSCEVFFSLSFAASIMASPISKTFVYEQRGELWWWIEIVKQTTKDKGKLMHREWNFMQVHFMIIVDFRRWKEFPVKRLHLHN